MASESDSDIPWAPLDSDPGSSVSSLGDEYDELMRSAIVTPYDTEKESHHQQEESNSRINEILSRQTEELARAAEAAERLMQENESSQPHHDREETHRSQTHNVEMAAPPVPSGRPGRVTLGPSPRPRDPPLPKRSTASRSSTAHDSKKSSTRSTAYQRSKSSTTSTTTTRNGRDATNAASQSGPPPATTRPTFATSTSATTTSAARKRAESMVHTIVEELGSCIVEEIDPLDDDLVSLQRELDSWTATLKKAIVTQFTHARMRSMQKCKDRLLEERRRFTETLASVQTQLDEAHELLRAKDEKLRQKTMALDSLAEALAREKQRREMQRTFNEWQVHLCNLRRKAFCTKLADAHRQRVLKRKAVAAWFGTIQSKWRERVERACQTRVEEAYVQMRNDYERRIAGLEQRLSDAARETAALHEHRVRYEETMKKAFMRGVCALNMEALSIFEKPGDAQETSTTTTTTTATSSSTRGGVNEREDLQHRSTSTAHPPPYTSHSHEQPRAQPSSGSNSPPPSRSGTRIVTGVPAIAPGAAPRARVTVQRHPAPSGASSSRDPDACPRSSVPRMQLSARS